MTFPSFPKLPKLNFKNKFLYLSFFGLLSLILTLLFGQIFGFSASSLTCFSRKTQEGQNSSGDLKFKFIKHADCFLASGVSHSQIFLSQNSLPGKIFPHKVLEINSELNDVSRVYFSQNYTLEVVSMHKHIFYLDKNGQILKTEFIPTWSEK